MSALARLPSRVTVYEVGPRDGLQTEQSIVPVDAKVTFVNMLSDAHLPAIEVTSFVRPGMIPQLSDAEDVLLHIDRHPGTRYTALIPNMQGMQRAAGGGLGGIALFTAASETFSRHNTNATIVETLDRFRPVIAEAKRNKIWIRAYVSTAFGCPYEGAIASSAVVRVALALQALGAEEIVLSDTIGVATPLQVAKLVDEVSSEIDVSRLALHFHDTRGTALANVLAGLESGVVTYDSSAGGLGGCPYAPGATGNLATEDLLYMLDGLGIETGVSLDKVVRATSFLQDQTGRSPASRYFHAVTS